MLIKGKKYRPKTPEELRELDVDIEDAGHTAYYRLKDSDDACINSDMLLEEEVFFNDETSLYLRCGMPTFHYKGYYWQEWMLVPISKQRLMETE